MPLCIPASFFFRSQASHIALYLPRYVIDWVSFGSLESHRDLQKSSLSYIGQVFPLCVVPSLFPEIFVVRKISQNSRIPEYHKIQGKERNPNSLGIPRVSNTFTYKQHFIQLFGSPETFLQSQEMTSLNSFLDLKNFRTFGDFLIPPTCAFLEDSEGDDFKSILNTSLVSFGPAGEWGALRKERWRDFKGGRPTGLAHVSTHHTPWPCQRYSRSQWRERRRRLEGEVGSLHCRGWLWTGGWKCMYVLNEFWW
jgi:hypothetical protein